MILIGHFLAHYLWANKNLHQRLVFYDAILYVESNTIFVISLKICFVALKEEFNEVKTLKQDRQW